MITRWLFRQFRDYWLDVAQEHSYVVTYELGVTEMYCTSPRHQNPPKWPCKDWKRALVQIEQLGGGEED